MWMALVLTHSHVYHETGDGVCTIQWCNCEEHSSMYQYSQRELTCLNNPLARHLFLCFFPRDSS